MATQTLVRPSSASPETNVRITPSKADNWQQCACRYSFQELINRQQRGSEYSFRLAFGNASHAMFAGLNGAILGGSVLPGAEEVLSQHWNDSHFQCDEDVSDARERALPMLQRYFDHLTVNHLTVQACERFVETPRMRINDRLRVTLSGKIDVVLEAQDGTIFIEDYKTGLLPTRDAFERLLSTTIYQLLGRLLYPEAPRIVVGQLQPVIGMHVSTTLTQELVAAARHEIKAMATAIASYPPATDDNFPAVPGEYCSWCPARQTHCPVYKDIAGEEEAF